MEQSNMKDNCVTCQTPTVYDRDDHIDFRIGYIEGSGQLCLDCFELIYIKEGYNAQKNNNDENKKITWLRKYI